ncbi:MAG: hypothetical protein KKF89_04140, partial [Nanoarchaeota archaeon]|nr:hypothetical protein [Nanoarchaeota archaeon]
EGNIGETIEYNVNLVNKSTSAYTTDNSNILDQLYALLDSLPKKTVQQKQVLEALEYENNIKQSIKTVERTIRDIYNIDFRRDLTTEEKAAKQKELMNVIDDIYQSTPTDIDVLGSKSFVKYVDETELETIIFEYAAAQNFQDANSYFKAALQTQKEATITTSIKNVKLYFLNGSVEEITLVVRDLDFINDNLTFKIIEHLPKELVQSTDEMVILTDNKIIKKDPIIEFEKTDKIVYYVRGLKDLDLFQKANTIILPEDYLSAVNSITGRAIFSFDTDINGKTWLVFLVIILVLIYGGYHFESFEKAKHLYFLIAGDKKMHNMKMLINDAYDNIEARNYEKAYLIYREIKLYYEKLSIPAKNEIYISVVDICNKLDFEYSQEIMRIISKKIEDNQIDRADRLYKKLRAIYKRLNEEDKNILYDDIVKISGRILQ